MMVNDILSQIIDYRKRELNIPSSGGSIDKETIIGTLGKASASTDGYLSKEDYEKFINLSGGNVETIVISIASEVWIDNSYTYANEDINSTDFIEVFLLHSTNIENVIYVQETLNFEKIISVNTIDNGIEFKTSSPIDINLNVMIRRNII
jgi:hypothetical protein